MNACLLNFRGGRGLTITLTLRLGAGVVFADVGGVGGQGIDDGWLVNVVLRVAALVFVAGGGGVHSAHEVVGEQTLLFSAGGAVTGALFDQHVARRPLGTAFVVDVEDTSGGVSGVGPLADDTVDAIGLTTGLVIDGIAQIKGVLAL